MPTTCGTAWRLSSRRAAPRTLSRALSHVCALRALARGEPTPRAPPATPFFCAPRARPLVMGPRQRPRRPRACDVASRGPWYYHDWYLMPPAYLTPRIKRQCSTTTCACALAASATPQRCGDNAAVLRRCCLRRGRSGGAAATSVPACSAAPPRSVPAPAGALIRDGVPLPSPQAGWGVAPGGRSACVDCRSGALARVHRAGPSVTEVRLERRGGRGRGGAGRAQGAPVEQWYKGRGRIGGRRAATRRSSATRCSVRSVATRPARTEARVAPTARPGRTRHGRPADAARAPGGNARRRRAHRDARRRRRQHGAVTRRARPPARLRCGLPRVDATGGQPVAAASDDAQQRRANHAAAERSDAAGTPAARRCRRVSPA
jgi:hypothetical protein